MNYIKIVEPSVALEWMTKSPLKTIDMAARTCYKSEDKATKGSSERMVRKLISMGHEAMLEHASASFRIVCDRGVSHELVRHRLFSFAQESTRYCNYVKKGVEVVTPSGLNGEASYQSWYEAVEKAAYEYCHLLSLGASPQVARSVLPTCLKTEIVITGNFREWRHFLRLRTAKTAHPDMRIIAKLVLAVLRENCLPLVGDINI